MLEWALYYADFINFYSPTQLCGGGTTKSNFNELPISVPLSLFSRRKVSVFSLFILKMGEIYIFLQNFLTYFSF